MFFSAKLLRFLLMIATMAILAPRASAAQGSWFEMTNCTLETLNGHEFGEVTFTIHNVFPDYILAFDLIPPPNSTPDDTCHVISASSPPGWRSFLSSSGGVYWEVTGAGSEIAPGGTVAGFKMILSRPLCCYRFRFFNAFIEPIAQRDTCISCPGQTPTSPSTWGRLKQHYR